MYACEGRIYSRHETTYVVWEPSWQMFRPLEQIVWNPSSKRIEPFYGSFALDIFDREYGFGSAEMRIKCEEFTDDSILLVEYPSVLPLKEFWKWAGGKTWIGDRFINVHPCFSLHGKTYLKSVSDVKTCRVLPRRNWTRKALSRFR